MLPRSSEAGSGAIGWWQWLKIMWNYFWTPRFNPLTVIRLLIDLLHCATCLTTSTCLATNVTYHVKMCNVSISEAARQVAKKCSAKKLVPALRQSLRKVEPDSSSRNACNKNVS